MKLNEKIKEIRKKSGSTLEKMQDLMLESLGPKEALSRSTLIRIEQGQTVKLASIVKICHILGVTLSELFENTDLQESMIIRKNQRFDNYEYNDKVSADIINSPSSKMLFLEVTISAFGKTLTEQDPSSKGQFEKIIYVVSGELSCIIGEEKHILKAKDCMTFNSCIAHHFENNTKKKCVFTVVQNPKYY